MMEKNAAEKLTNNQDMPGPVRPMEKNDIDQIVEIEKKSFVAPWSKIMFEETVLSPIFQGLVIEQNKRTIVGYIVFYTAGVEAHIMNLATNPAERKQGYARQLLIHALEFFREKGVLECYLEVREHNRAAQRLYECFGFEVIGRRKKYYPETGEDALVMQLLL
jgi:[ribosomal protein S18]-alanine N-acetyltransferase